MARTLKVTGNHFMHDRGAKFLRVIIASSRTLCCLLSIKRKKHDFQVFLPTYCRDHFFSLQCSDKTIIRFGFWDVQNNQGLVKADNLTETLITLDITKTESNNCL